MLVKFSTLESEKTKINSNWSDNQIIENYVHALYYRGRPTDPIEQSATPLFGQPKVQKTATFHSNFTDGTEVKIIWRNYQQRGQSIVENDIYFEILGF